MPQIWCNTYDTKAVAKITRKDSHLEMKNARIVLLEALVPGNHSVKQLFIQGERGNGCQKPTVSWKESEEAMTDGAGALAIPIAPEFVSVEGYTSAVTPFLRLDMYRQQKGMRHW